MTSSGTDTLGSLASVLRSKNAGPYQLTFDVFFDDQPTYERVKRSGVITGSLVSRLYGVPVEEVLHVVWHDFARGVKFTIVRPHVSGGPGERDTYGCQQHAPLLSVEIPRG